jgi:hypothetical protein
MCPCDPSLSRTSASPPDVRLSYNWDMTSETDAIHLQLQSIHSSSSDRSSLSSGSPDSSPMQHQIQPSHQVTPAFSLPSASNSYMFSNVTPSASSSPMKLHQPAAIRSRNAIPIVNPSTGMRVASPPVSVSPGQMHLNVARRW